MNRPSTALAVACAAASALLLAACGGGDASPAKSLSAIPAPTSVGVQTFGGTTLDEEAMSGFAAKLTKDLSGSRAAFLADFAPSMAAQQGQWYDNVHTVPFTVRQIQIALPQNRVNYGTQKLSALLSFRHQISGIDPAPVDEWYEATFAKTGDKVVVTSLSGGAPGVDDSGRKYARYYPAAWDVGPIAYVKGDGVAAIGPASQVARLRSIAAVAGSTLKQDRSVFAQAGVPAQSRHGYLWTLTRPGEDVFKYFGGSVVKHEAGYDGLTNPAFATDPETADLELSKGAVTSRITVKPVDDASLAEIARHEQVHALAQEWVGDGWADAPTWVVEGLASYLEVPAGSGAASGRLVDASRTPASLSIADKGFYEGTNAQVSGRYGLAYAAIASAVDSVGMHRMMAAVRSLYLNGSDENLAKQLHAMGFASEKDVTAKARAWAARH